MFTWTNYPQIGVEFVGQIKQINWQNIYNKQAL